MADESKSGAEADRRGAAALFPAAHPSASRLEALDGLRGIAASMVVIAHAVSALAKPTAAVFALHQSPVALLSNGGGGVHLFFVLSGYVLARPAVAAIDSSGVTRTVGWLQFYARRALRIHPPYVVGLLVSWLLSGWIYDRSAPVEALSQTMIDLRRVHISPIALFHALLFPGRAYVQLPVGWTLQVEALFSILLPLLMLVATRVHWLVLIVVAIPLLGVPQETLFDFSRFALDFAFGIAIWSERDALARLFERLHGVLRALVLVTGIGLLTSPVYFMLDHRAPVRSLVLYCAGAALIVMCTIHMPAVGRFLAQPLLGFIGRISYSVYLIHAPIIILLTPWVTHGLNFFEGTLFVIASLLLSYAIAPLFYVSVEAPAMQAGYRLSARIGRRAERSPGGGSR
ncbi:MAG: acyltransferase [Myxococcota bacterium]|nr:acyltransferase [Myxococcota bacterium]